MPRRARGDTSGAPPVIGKLSVLLLNRSGGGDEQPRVSCIWPLGSEKSDAARHLVGGAVLSVVQIPRDYESGPPPCA